MSNNYGEIFCQAAEILAQNLIDKVSYDRTIVCSIINDDEKDLGKYRVSTGEAIFDAYTSDTSFKKDDQVYVSIPGGDWNEQKLIIAKKAKDINQPITYKDPFNSYVDITNNLINSNLNQQGLIANDLKKEEVLLWSYNKENSGALIESKGDILGGYTRLGINAAFQAWLRDFGIVIGNYGLRLEIETIQEDSSEVNSKFCYLNCLDMIGNPYNYEGFYNQKKLFNIADLKNISSMRLWFYQEKESFKNHKNEVVNPHISPNIFIKDVSVSLGYDANHFENDTIILYTMDSQKYDAKTIPLENNHRQLQVRWIHKFEDNTIKVIQRDDDIDYTLTWYRYEQGARSDTAWSGVDWIPLSKQVQSILEGSQNNVDYEIKDPEWVKYNNHSIIAHTPIREADYNKSWLLPDITKAEEKIKVIIEYNGTVIDSPILVFSNVDEVVNKTTIDAVQALSINCEDNSFGNYLIYNIGGGILNHAESQKVREFKAYFNSAKDNIPDDEMAELVEAESIEWIIPTKNTMIDINHLVDGAQETYIDDNGYYHIFKYDGGASTNDGIDGNIRNQNSQQYRIKSHYSSSYSDNTIKCVITKHKIKYTAIKELTFGPAGTSGTDYTFVLDFEDNVNAMTIGDTAKVVVRARLYDYEGKEIEGLEEKNIEWSVEGANYISLRELNEIDKNGQKISNNHRRELQLLTSTIPNDNYTILKATLSGWGDFDLNAYLPIPIRSDKKYQYISGATFIGYNSLGYLEDYYQKPYCLYIDSQANPEYGVWNIFSANDNGNKIDPYRPQIKVNSNNQYTIRPVNVYAEGSMKKLCIVGSINGKKVWSQPLFVYQNKYPSSIINDWSGELTIDNANNAILAAKIAAGKKHDNNTFSGVMMGDWSGNDGDIGNHTGIYGFKEGQATFGFRDNGTAFIGKPNKGRLEFNGEKSTIQSNSYIDGYGGMMLDFDDGFIKLYTPNQSHSRSKSIILDAGATSNPFTIGTNFKVDWDGSLWANNGEFTGTITAEDGKIGNWIIGSSTSDNLAGCLYSSNQQIILDPNNSKISGGIFEGSTLSSPTGGITLDGYFTLKENSSAYLGKLASNLGGDAVEASGIGFSYGSSSVVKATGSSTGIIFGNNHVALTSNSVNIVAKSGNVNMGDSNGTLNISCKNINFTNTNGSIDCDIPAANQHGIYARFAP